MKTPLKFLVFVAMVLIGAMPIIAQLKVTDSAFLLGKNAAVTDGIRFVVTDINGVYWKYKDHYLKINLKDRVPALSGTNGWFHIASFHFSENKPELMVLNCRDIYLLSDERAKHNITDLSTSLGRLNALQLQRSVSMDDGDNGYEMLKESLPRYGLSNTEASYHISNETLTEYYPGLVTVDEDGAAYVDYIGLIPVLIQSIKEAREALQTQEMIIDNLKKKLAQ